MYVFWGMYLRKVTVKIRRVSSEQNVWSKTSPIYVLLGEHFFYIFWKAFIVKVHTEAILKGLKKPDLIKLVL